jgi:tetratricopeptide (TPR) repeat protein
MSKTPKSPDAVEVFYAYSHRDERLRNRLASHLSILRRNSVITDWHDRRIGAGMEWKGQIDEHLNTARIILLLVSADFLASDYCIDVEMKRAMERHELREARVIPIILRAVDNWQVTAFGKLQALPTDGKPITSWPNRDEAFVDVARGIRVAVAELAPSTVPVDLNTEVGTPPVVWNVPHARNPNFTGRESLLTALRDALTSGGTAALTQTRAITGLGGVGKTQLAVEYAYRYATEYNLVWWVPAEEPATLAATYARLAQELPLPQGKSPDQRAIVQAVRHWLEQHPGWLLVFDNASRPADLGDYLPQGAAGHVLVTSRNPNWLAVASPLRVPLLPRQEAIDFLLKRTRQADATAARELAAALGDLPLALEQAGAYMEQTGTSLARYLELFQTRQRDLLRRGTPSTDYPHTVATTWEIAFQQLPPEAAALLNLCAFLAPDDIPRELVMEGAEGLPEPLAAASADPLALGEAIATLRRYSLLEVGGEGWSVHRLVQAVARDRLALRTKKRWAEAAVRLVDSSFPFDSDDVRTWPACARLLPHALAAAGHAEALAVAAEATGRLLNQVGGYVRGRADFQVAKTVHQRALALAEKAYGLDHPTVATRLNNLGIVLRDLGDLAGAREHFQRGLAIDKKAYGPDHPTVATHVNNLGSVLQDLGDLAGARSHFQRGLAIDERAYGPDHPTVANCLNNLGLVLQSLGDLAGARAHFQRALAIDERAYGPDHPTLANRLNNLGGVLRDLGDLAGAREHFQRALAINEAAYGPDHPDVATGVNNLGSALRDLGDLAGAREHYQRALAIDERLYGPDHSSVARDVNNLGSVFQDLGDSAGAREHFQRALAIDQKAYGPDHPTVATKLNNLGEALRDLGDLAGAREHFQRALAIVEKAYGPDHPTVAIRVNNLGSVLWDLGDLAGAREHFERAWAIIEKAYGPDHPRVATSLNNLGSVLHALGDLAGARAHYQRALGIFRARLGEDHPSTVRVRNNLASLPH